MPVQCDCTPENRSNHEPSATTKRLLEVNLPAARTLSEQYGDPHRLNDVLETLERSYKNDHRLEATLAARAARQ